MTNEDYLISITDAISTPLCNINDTVDISKCGTSEPETKLQSKPIVSLLTARKPTDQNDIKLGTTGASSLKADITVLPWKSENILIINDKSDIDSAESCKINTQFSEVITLPKGNNNNSSKLARNRLDLKEKSGPEARRILLSDINFTSMVPQLSRSVDQINKHLIPKGELITADNHVDEETSSQLNSEDTFHWSFSSSSSSTATITATSNACLDSMTHGSSSEISASKLVPKFITASSSSLFWRQNQRASFEYCPIHRSIDRDHEHHLRPSVSVPYVSSLSRIDPNEKFSKIHVTKSQS